MATFQKQDHYLTQEMEGRLMFRCAFCVAHRCTRRRIVNRITDYHDQSPAKPVYRQYMRNPIVPIPRTTACRRKLMDNEGQDKPPEKQSRIDVLMEVPEQTDELTGKTTLENMAVREDDVFNMSNTVLDYVHNSDAALLSSEVLDSESAQLEDAAFMSSKEPDSVKSFGSDQFSCCGGSDNDSSFLSSDSLSDDSENSSDSKNSSACCSASAVRMSTAASNENFCNLAFLSYAMKHSLAGNAVDDLIDLFKSTSSELWLPKNYNDLLQNVYQSEVLQYHYCRFWC